MSSDKITYKKGIGYEWVIGRYDGDRGASVQEHADAGLTYFIRQSTGHGKNRSVVAAFRRPLIGPCPDHLEKADEYQVKKLEEKLEKRLFPEIIRERAREAGSIKDIFN